MYPVFETICLLNGKVQLATSHHRRMELSSLRIWGTFKNREYLWPHLESIAEKGRVKCRLYYNQHQENWELSAYYPKPIHELVLWEDPWLQYPLKYTQRKSLEYAKQKLGLAEGQEILYTKEGFLCDTSYSNVVLWDGKDWVTPVTSLLPGIKRQYLLDTFQIKQKPIHQNELGHYQMISLINVMLEPGEIQIATEAIRKP